MNDPDEAHRLTQERIAKLEKDKEQAERVVEEERARTVESRKNEESSKRLAEEEKQKCLEAEAEVRELRARLGLQGHG
jgi:hypothetical protein